MRPSEVIVLYVKVLFTLSPCIVEYDDVFLGGKPVIGKYAAIGV